MSLDPALAFLGHGPPPCGQLLGWTFKSWDEETRTLTVAFTGKPEFANPAGHVQGGILLAMMDDTMSPAMVMASKGKFYPPTVGLSASFLRPVRVGPITVVGRVVQIGRTVAFCEAELFDERGRLCVRATCNSTLVPNTAIASGAVDTSISEAGAPA